MNITLKTLSLDTEQFLFLAGVIIAVFFKWFGFKRRDDDFDSPKEQLNFWLVFPLGFITAALTVFDRNYIYRNWLFGSDGLRQLLKYFANLFFGLCFAVLIPIVWSQLKRQFEDLVTHVCDFVRLKLEKIMEIIRIYFPYVFKSQETFVVPGAIDRFTAESQISYLKSFLALMENKADRESLEFWRNRQDDTEVGGFTYRVSLFQEQLEKLKFSTFSKTDYLALEFWKSKSGKFRIRTTYGLNESPKKFSAVDSSTIQLQ